MKTYLLEETYEVLEALDKADAALLKDELGDLLFQIIFHAQIGKERRKFTIRDVLKTVTKKMIRRHPHVFADGTATTSQEVLARWEILKRREGTGRNRKSVLDGVPRSLPSLLQAQQLQRKASRVGFDWNDEEPVWGKVREELSELAAARKSGNRKHLRSELGDVLFSVVNLARFLDIDAEDSLRQANQRFDSRFRAIERRLRRNGKTVAETDSDELDLLWKRVKRKRGARGRA